MSTIKIKYSLLFSRPIAGTDAVWITFCPFSNLWFEIVIVFVSVLIPAETKSFGFSNIFLL